MSQDMGIFVNAIKSVSSFGSNVSGFFSSSHEASLDTSRTKIEKLIQLDRFLFWGSFIPVVGTSFATCRVVYGFCIVTFALCEVINKVALSTLSSDRPKGEPDAEVRGLALIQALKEGALPTLIYGIQHIGAGMLVSGSVLGKVSAIAWELLVRPKLPQAFVTSATVDLKACSQLIDRVKRHSLVQSVSKAWNEFIALVQAKPAPKSA